MIQTCTTSLFLKSYDSQQRSAGRIHRTPVYEYPVVHLNLWAQEASFTQPVAQTGTCMITRVAGSDVALIFSLSTKFILIYITLSHNH